MKKESLRVLGIEVSRDFSAKELLIMSDEELLDPIFASKISALREFCEEFHEISLEDFPPIKSSTEAVVILAPHLRHLDHEECWIVLLNRANKVLSKFKVSSGTVCSCPIDVARITIRADVRSLVRLT